MILKMNRKAKTASTKCVCADASDRGGFWWRRRAAWRDALRLGALRSVVLVELHNATGLLVRGLGHAACRDAPKPPYQRP